MCAGESFVVTGVGDDDVCVCRLGGSVDELLTEVVESDAVLGLERFGLVFDADDGLVLVEGNIGVGHTGFGHHQDDGGTLCGAEGTVDAEAFNLVIGVADACGVDESESDASQLDGVFDGIAGGALDVADDGTFFANKSIEECGFTDIWSSDDGDWNAVLKGITRMEGVGQMGDACVNPLGKFHELGTVGKFEVFVVGEVELEF